MNPRSLWTPDGRHLASSSKPRSCQQVELPKTESGGIPSFIMPGRGKRESVFRLPSTAGAGWYLEKSILLEGNEARQPSS